MKDIEHFLPPQDATQRRLDEAMESLRPFTDMDLMRSLEVKYEVGDRELKTRVHINSDGASSRITHELVVLSGAVSLSSQWKRDERFFELQEQFRPIVEEAIEGLEDKEAAWLRRVWSLVTGSDPELVAYEIESLLSDDCPYGVFEVKTFQLPIKDIPGVGSISGQWDELSENIIEQGGLGFPLDEVTFNSERDGKTYTYKRYVNGYEEMSIIDPSLPKVRREITDTSEIEIDGGGFGITIGGTPEFVAHMRASLQQYQEDKTNGLLKPTEGGMQTLISALTSAKEFLEQRSTRKPS